MTEQAIIEYDEFQQKMDEIKTACDFVPDVSTPDGYEASKRVALKVGKVASKLEATRKELKAESLAYGRRVDGQAKSIKAALDEYREPHLKAYKAVDEEKKQREARRLADQQQRVDDLAAIPSLMIDSDSEGIRMCLQDLRNNDCEGFYEMTEAALLARNSSITRLESMYTDRLENEKRERELLELREKQAAEDARREEAEEKARAQQKIIDDLQAEKDARQQAEAEENARKEAAIAKAEREEEERKAEDARKLEAEQRAQELAKQALIDAKEEAEREKAAAVQKAIDDAEKEAQRIIDAQREAAEEKARQQREDEAKEARRQANKKHRVAVELEVENQIMSAVIIDKDTAIAVVQAIVNGEIPALSIQY